MGNIKKEEVTMKKGKLLLAGVAALMMSSSAAIAELPERTIENIFPWSAG